MPGAYTIVQEAEGKVHETVGTTEEETLPFLTEKKHPALEMDPIM